MSDGAMSEGASSEVREEYPGLTRVLPDRAEVPTADLCADYRRLRGLRVDMITSVDGGAALGSISAGLSDPVDQWHMDLLRRVCDVLIVGAGTLRDEGYGPMRVRPASVAWRRAHGLPDHPVLAILSASLDLPAGAGFLAADCDDVPHPIVLTCRPGAGGASGAGDAGGAAAQEWERRAERLATSGRGVEVVECARAADAPGSAGAPRARVDLTDALRRLAGRGLTHQLCEGGPAVMGALVAADAIDELCLAVSPTLVGAGAPRIVGEAPAHAGHSGHAVPPVPPVPPVPLTLVHLLTHGDLLLSRWARAAGTRG